ncbi:TraR/DksA family transcriptional regulator [Ramlibacter rhizophilus]|nr:TraR/DksA family transcriptional regulator [Ramlibacter rhizophilus]
MSLDPSKLSELDQLLQSREAELAAAAHASREEFATPGSHGWPEVKDSVEDGDARMMDSLDLMQLQRQEAELSQVRAARQRLAEGSYGTCEDCGRDIPFERLKIVPTARYCVQDEERREKAAAAR